MNTLNFRVEFARDAHVVGTTSANAASIAASSDSLIAAAVVLTSKGSTGCDVTDRACNTRLRSECCADTLVSNILKFRPVCGQPRSPISEVKMIDANCLGVFSTALYAAPPLQITMTDRSRSTPLNRIGTPSSMEN